MRRWTIVSVLVALVVVGTWLPRLVGEVEFYRANVWPLLRQWSDPAGQAQLAASPALADVLIAADRRLPPDARVILLTAGEDVDTSEYIAFHRALYYLSPRPVWWVIQNPEPASQRQPRWYQTSAPAQADWLLGLSRLSRWTNETGSRRNVDAGTPTSWPCPRRGRWTARQ